MLRRVLVCLAAVSLAMAQTLTVQQLTDVVLRQINLIDQKKSTDQETAKGLAAYHLSEKLELSVIEELQSAGAGQLTIKALQKLQDHSKNQKAAVIEPVVVLAPMPIPTTEEQGKVLDEARDYVKNYDNEMTDFICTEVEKRMKGGKTIKRASGEPYYLQVDDIISRITYYKHVETKTPVFHNNRPVHGDLRRLGGATSQGDFENMLQAVFDPASEARFQWAKWTTLRTHLTMVFSFHVARDHSSYRLEVPDSKWSTLTTYSGLIYLDNAPKHPLTKLVVEAEEIPLDFPIQKAQTTLDYRYTEIGDRSYLLPYNEEIEMENAGVLTKNSNSFQNYQKYEVGSEVNYDITANLTGVPDSSLKESPVKPPAVDCKNPKNKDVLVCKGK